MEHGPIELDVLEAPAAHTAQGAAADEPSLVDYRHILRREFDERTRRHPRYSLRAFARQLSLSPGYLSDVFNRRRSLSEALALRVAERLAWDEKATKLFVNLVRYDHVRDDSLRRHLEHELAELGGDALFTPLDGRDIPDGVPWYYLVLAELFDCIDFVADERWMAKKLRLTVIEVEAALHWLGQVGILVGKGPQLRKRLDAFVFRAPRPAAVNHLYRQMLGIAREAVGQGDGPKEFGVINMAFPPERMPAAIERIRQFQRDMARLSDPLCNSAVYHLGVQFFRLDDAGS